MWGGTPWANSQSRIGVDVGGYTMGKQSEQDRGRRCGAGQRSRLKPRVQTSEQGKLAT
jgi:hypothetical protein